MNKQTLITTYFFAFIITIGLVSSELPLMPLAYNLDIKYNNGDLSLENITIEHLYIPDESSMQEDYVIKLFDVYGEEKYINKFSLGLEISSSVVGCFDEDKFNTTRCPNPSYTKLNSTIQRIVVPYSFTGEIIEIYSQDNELKLSINVSEYSDYCGDNKCTESYLSCPQDCEATPEEQVVLDKYEKQYESENSSFWNTILTWKYYIIAIVSLIITIIIIVNIIRNKGKGVPPQTQQQYYKTIPP